MFLANLGVMPQVSLRLEFRGRTCRRESLGPECACGGKLGLFHVEQSTAGTRVFAVLKKNCRLPYKWL